MSRNQPSPPFEAPAGVRIVKGRGSPVFVVGTQLFQFTSDGSLVSLNQQVIGNDAASVVFDGATATWQLPPRTGSMSFVTIWRNKQIRSAAATLQKAFTNSAFAFEVAKVMPESANVIIAASGAHVLKAAIALNPSLLEHIDIGSLNAAQRADVYEGLTQLVSRAEIAGLARVPVQLRDTNLEMLAVRVNLANIAYVSAKGLVEVSDDAMRMDPRVIRFVPDQIQTVQSALRALELDPSLARYVAPRLFQEASLQPYVHYAPIRPETPDEIAGYSRTAIDPDALTRQGQPLPTQLGEEERHARRGPEAPHPMPTPSTRDQPRMA